MTTHKTRDKSFNLIKKLSKSEKRFFTTYSDFQSGDKLYFQIFRAMDKMKEYNEDKLLAIFKDKNMKDEEKRRKISVTKNYLYNQLLKSLRIFTNEKESVNIQLYNLLVDVQTLRSKELFHPALKRLKKAKKIAIEQEKLLILLEILALEIDIMIEHYPKNLENCVYGLYENTHEAIRQVQEYLQLKEYDKKLFIPIRLGKKPLSDKLITEIEQSKYLNVSDYPFNSFYAKVHYHKLKALYHLIKGEPKTAAHYRLKVLELWRSNEQIKKMEHHEYKLAVTNYIASLHDMGKYSEIPKLIQELEAIPAKKPGDKAETFQNVYLHKLLLYVNTEKYRQAEELIPKIEEGLKIYHAKINEARVITLYYNMILLYFVQGGKEKFRIASKLLNKILRSERRTAREDIKRFAWILEIILHYELGSDLVIEHIFNVASQEVKNPHPFEILAFKHLRKITSVASTQEKDLLKTFRTELKEYTENHNHFGTNELDYWINSKIRNCTIADILKEESGGQASGA